MSILTVDHLSHGFGDRAIFQDVSFRMLKGEHIGLVGANGEGKSTFFNIVTGKLAPDAGKIEWAKNVRIGYLDQHTVLEKGMTIRDVLKSAFSYLFEMEARMNDICDKLGSADEEAMNKLMEGRTSFVIAHRLSTIKDAELIVYMEHGDIKEVGNHRELLAKGGYYAALYNSQFAAENAG